MLKALLLVALAANTPGSGPVSRGDLLKFRQYQTPSAMTLFVDSTGSDSGACTASGTSACATIQGAINKIPKLVTYPVTITVAAGNYTGALLDGFNITEAGYITLSGTMANSTITSGLVTGTLASATAGSSFTTSHGTATVTGAGWTVNDLRGHFLTITGGTGSGQSRPIESNTATVATIAGGWATTPDATSTFAIQDPATVINATVAVTASDTATTTAVGFGLNNTETGQRALVSGSRIAVMRFKFTTGTRNVYVFAGGVTIRQCWFAVAANGLILSESTFAYMIENYATLGQPVATAANSSVAYWNNVTNGLAFVAQITGAAGAVDVRGTYDLGCTSACYRFATNLQGSFVMQGAVIDCNSAGGNGIDNNSTNGGTTIRIVNSSISNCSTALKLVGHEAALVGVTGSGSTTGMNITRGAKLAVDATSTLTGTTEATIDGTTTTLAAMRALTPKAITGVQYGSAFFE